MGNKKKVIDFFRVKYFNVSYEIRGIFLRLLFFAVFSVIQAHVVLANEELANENSVIAATTFTLNKNNNLSIELEPEEHVLFRVEQPNADAVVRIEAGGKGTTAPVLVASISANNYLPEFILISADLCYQCNIIISAKNAIHQKGKVRVTAERLPSVSDKLQAFRSLTKGAQHLYASKPYTVSDKQQLGLAIQHFQQAAARFGTSGANAMQLHSLFLLSEAHHYNFDFVAQKQTLVQLMAGQSLTPHMRVNALTSLAKLYHEDMYSIEQAHQMLAQAFKLAMESDDALLVAMVETAQARLYETSDDINRAISLWQKAADTQIAHANLRPAIKNLINLGWAEYRRDNIVDAVAAYNKALIYVPQKVASLFKTDINIKLAKTYRALGDFDRANKFIDLALVDSGNYSHSSVDGWAKQEKARVLMVSGQPGNALQYLRQAQIAYEKQGAQVDLINIDYFIGDILIDFGKFDEALEYVKRVLAFDLKADSPINIASGYNKLARIAWKQNRFTDAVELQNQAVNHIADIEDTTLKPTIFGQAAAVYTESGMAERGQYYFDKAKALLPADTKEYRSIRIQYDYALSLNNVGDQSKAKKVLAPLPFGALAHSKKIMQQDLKRKYVATLQDIIELSNHLHAGTQDNWHSLRLSESLRATSLSLSLLDKQKHHSLDQSLSEKRELLFNALLTQALLLENSDKEKEKVEIQQTIKGLSSELYKLEIELYDREYDVQYADQEPYSVLQLQELQTQLSQDTAILFFDTGEPSSHLWLITKNLIKHFELPSQKQLTEMSNTLYRLLTDKTKSPFAASSALSNVLLRDLQPELTDINHLAIVPDGALHMVPFASLTLPKSGESLSELFSISYAASLVYSHTEDMVKGDSMDNKVFAVGNPKMRQGQRDASASFKFVELPYSEVEISSIEKIASDDSLFLTEADANKKQVQVELRNNYDIIHFATHGISNRQNPMVSGLLLSNVDAQDNYLMAGEIAALDVPGSMVVLSGCETTQGELVSGEGLLGLSRAFLEARAELVVGSLWQVQDKATAVLFEQFYKHLLLQQLSAAESLRLAQKFVKNYRRANGMRPWRHPFYWAGFVIHTNKDDMSG